MNDAYVTVEQANAYHDARQSSDVWFGLDEETRLRNLVSASDVVDGLMRYRGIKADESQLREFPRIFAEGETAQTPLAVLAAVCELALSENITGLMPHPQKLRNVGGVMLTNGDCDGGCGSEAVSKKVLAWLKPYRLTMIPIQRG